MRGDLGIRVSDKVEVGDMDFRWEIVRGEVPPWSPRLANRKPSAPSRNQYPQSSIDKIDFDDNDENCIDGLHYAVLITIVMIQFESLLST